MPRTARTVGFTGWNHIIIRGINRENLFYDEEDYKCFVITMGRVRKKHEFETAAYCLMNNHVHFLMRTEDGTSSEIIKKILIIYASYYNKKYNRVGHVFQDRYRSEPVDDETYLLTVARYIYLNPQKAGICPAKEYPYTFIQIDGILSRYFKSSEAFMNFLETENDDKCMEYNIASGYSDEEALKMILKITGEENPQLLQEYERKRRDGVLCQLKETGLRIRQISRLTGINRNIVQRA